MELGNLTDTSSVLDHTKVNAHEFLKSNNTNTCKKLKLSDQLRQHTTSTKFVHREQFAVNNSQALIN